VNQPTPSFYRCRASAALSNLLDLNLELAEREEEGQPVVGPGTRTVARGGESAFNQ
jgi:hypothetical protein